MKPPEPLLPSPCAEITPRAMSSPVMLPLSCVLRMMLPPEMPSALITLVSVRAIFCVAETLMFGQVKCQLVELSTESGPTLVGLHQAGLGIASFKIETFQPLASTGQAGVLLPPHSRHPKLLT